MDTKTTTKADRTRRMVIDKAAVLFNRKGFAGTSIQDIMAATGLSKGGLYGHFGGKEEIAVAAFMRAVEVVDREVNIRTWPLTSTVDKLKAVVAFYRERVLDPPVEGGCPIQNTAVEADDNLPVLRERVVSALDRWQGRIVQAIARGIAEGEIRPDVDAQAFAVSFIGQIEGGILLARLYRDAHYFDVMVCEILKNIENLKN